MAEINFQGRDDILHDSGYASRKFWLTVLAMGLIVGVGVLSGLAVFSALGGQLPAIIGGVLGALAAYLGANVTTKWAAAGVRKAQAGATKPKTTKTPPPPADEPGVEHG